MGINSFIVAVSSAAGPTIAAAILSIASTEMVIFNQRTVGVLSPCFWRCVFCHPMVLAPVNPRFDLPSAVMNALTFGLLITALSGFRSGAIADVNCCGTGGNGCCWYFLYSPPAFSSRTAATGGFTAYPAVFTFYLPSVCSFCAQMLAMVSLPFYLQTVLGRSEVETGLLLTPWPLATMVMAPLAGYLIERVHAGLLGALGLFIMAAGLFPWFCCPRHLRISILSGR